MGPVPPGRHSLARSPSISDKPIVLDSPLTHSNNHGISPNPARAPTPRATERDLSRRSPEFLEAHHPLFSLLTQAFAWFSDPASESRVYQRLWRLCLSSLIFCRHFFSQLSSSASLSLAKLHWIVIYLVSGLVRGYFEAMMLDLFILIELDFQQPSSPSASDHLNMDDWDLGGKCFLDVAAHGLLAASYLFLYCDFSFASGVDQGRRMV